MRPRLSRYLRWLIGIRLLVTTTIALPFLLLRLSQPLRLAPFDFIYRVAGWLYLASLLYLLLLRLLRDRPRVQAWIQLAGDTACITLLVYQMGGAANHFSLLYLGVIGVAAFLLHRRAAVTFALIGWFTYAATVLAMEIGWLPHPGSGLYIELSRLRLIYDLGIQFFGFLAMAYLTSSRVLDVSRVEEELEQERATLADLEVLHRDILESVPSGILTTDLAGRVIAANPVGLEILGFTSGEIDGRSVTESGMFDEAAWRHLCERAESDPGRRAELTLTRNGRAQVIGYSLTTLRTAGGDPKGFVVIFQDLTDWRRLQEQLRMQDRMAAVGELATGVAHEIGNPLAAISGSVQMLSQREVGSSDRQLLSIIHRETERLSRTIRGLLRFARPENRRPSEFDVAELLEETWELLRNSPEVEENHRLELDIRDGNSTLVADRDQISQIFWNLARNALKAMPQGGTLRVEAGPQGGLYLLRFTDTGCGMSEEERANVFHPYRSYFDEGLGMGMAIVYRIVEEHGGRIDLDSEPGRGTTFTVALPRHPSETAAGKSE